MVSEILSMDLCADKVELMMDRSEEAYTSLLLCLSSNDNSPKSVLATSDPDRIIIPSG